MLRPAGAEAGPPLGELRSRERQHEERVVARPLEQVLDEVEEGRVGPLQVLEDEHDGALLGEPLEEEPPGGEEILPVAGRVLGEAEQVGESRLEPASLGFIPDALLEHRAQLRERFVRGVFLRDQCAHPHHLGERPVGDAVSVRETAAPVPQHLVDRPVEVLLELPGEARLADACDPDHRDEVRFPFLRRAVEVLLDEAQLARAADERRLELGRHPCASANGRDAERSEERERLASSP